MMHCLQSAGATSRLLLFGILGCLPAGTALGQAQPVFPTLPGPADSPAYLATQITARMRDNLQRLPDYTCTETIERTRQTLDGKILMEDTLHLEVGLIDNEEMFAWPGSDEFQGGLHNLVTSGSFGSGAYGIYAKEVFLNEDRPTLRPQGRVNLDDLDGGKELLKYGFTIPWNRNEFVMRVGKFSATPSFQGSIYVDPENLDLRRMNVILTDIPSELDIAIATDQVNYDRVKVGQERFLLPVSNVLTMANHRDEVRNYVRFENCHKFEGESTISFGDPALLEDAEQEATPNEVVQEITIPSGAGLHIVIDTKIVLDETAVGDLVAGEVIDNVRVDGEDLIPKGAKVTGRVIRMDRWQQRYVLAIQLIDISWKGGHASVDGYLESLPDPRIQYPGNRGMRLATVDGDNPLPGRRKPQVILIPRPAPKSIQNIVTYWRTY